MEDERLLAKRTFAQEKTRIEDSIGFGRIIREKPTQGEMEKRLVIAPAREIGNNFNVLEAFVLSISVHFERK